MVMTSKRATASGARRGEILKAALACFTELGWQAATMEEIRARSRASTGSIYHHFASKEQLAGALYAEGLRSYQHGLLRALARQAGAAAGIRAIVDHHLRWVSANPEWARYLFYQRQAEVVAASEGAIKEMNRDFFQAVFKWMKPHIESGKIAR